MSIIDVSKWNGDINWSKVKASGVDSVIIRCQVSTRKTINTDTKFKKNIEGAIAAGLKVGMYAYSFSKTASGGIQEAEYAIKLAEPYKDSIYYPIFIDIEETSCAKTSKEVCTAFCKKIEEAGYNAGICASASWWKDYLKGVNQWTRWIAQWGSKKPSNADIWQYSEKGKVNGISGNVDLDKVISYTPKPKPEPEPLKEYADIAVPILKRGDKCSEVKTIQTILKEQGYAGKDGKTLEVDGSFGPNTEYALTAFQKKHEAQYKVKPEGICDKTTWKVLIYFV